MRRLAAVGGAILLSAWSALSFAASPDPVKDCPKGLVCYTLDEAAKIDLKLIDLQKELAIAKAKNKHIGGALVCGPGVEAIDRESHLTAGITTACVVGVGFRF